MKNPLSKKLLRFTAVLTALILTLTTTAIKPLSAFAATPLVSITVGGITVTNQAVLPGPFTSVSGNILFVTASEIAPLVGFYLTPYSDSGNGSSIWRYVYQIPGGTNIDSVFLPATYSNPSFSIVYSAIYYSNSGISYDFMEQFQYGYAVCTVYYVYKNSPAGGWITSNTPFQQTSVYIPFASAAERDAAMGHINGGGPGETGPPSSGFTTAPPTSPPGSDNSDNSDCSNGGGFCSCNIEIIINIPPPLPPGTEPGQEEFDEQASNVIDNIDNLNSQADGIFSAMPDADADINDILAQNMDIDSIFGDMPRNVQVFGSLTDVSPVGNNLFKNMGLIGQEINGLTYFSAVSAVLILSVIFIMLKRVLHGG